PEIIEKEEILEKVKLREKAKSEKNYELADKIREELEKDGFFIFDFLSGSRVVSLKEEI
ncbi:MAG: cysteine--tRNA ligase, partial [Thermodesulfobacterium geofontis]